jgi:uncharacterized protein (TIGR03086 family)
MIDLTPTTDRARRVAAAFRDDHLDLTNPKQQPVFQVLNHLLGLCVAFRDAAAKEDGPTTNTPPAPVTDPLPDGWRDLLDARLVELAEAWQSPDAWQGMTKAGGVDLPGDVCGLVALDEVLLHGWDLARATGQEYDVTEAESEAVLPVVTPEDHDPDGSSRTGLFGPVVPAGDSARPFDRTLALAGRDPGWTA